MPPQIKFPTSENLLKDSLEICVWFVVDNLITIFFSVAFASLPLLHNNIIIYYSLLSSKCNFYQIERFSTNLKVSLVQKSICLKYLNEAGLKYQYFVLCSNHTYCGESEAIHFWLLSDFSLLPRYCRTTTIRGRVDRVRSRGVSGHSRKRWLGNIEQDCEQSISGGYKISSKQAGVEIFCDEAAVARSRVAKAIILVSQSATVGTKTLYYGFSLL